MSLASFCDNFEGGSLLKRSYREMAFLSAPLDSKTERMLAGSDLDPLADMSTNIGGGSEAQMVMLQRPQKRQNVAGLPKTVSVCQQLGQHGSLGQALLGGDAQDEAVSVFDGDCYPASY